MIVKIPVSIGELIDKITILEIKLDYVKDSLQKNNIKKELNLLNSVANKINYPESFKDELIKINSKLWNIENDIRIYEKEKIFDKNFISLARLVYLYNDLRAEIKRKINIHTESHIIEEKIY